MENFFYYDKFYNHLQDMAEDFEDMLNECDPETKFQLIGSKEQPIIELTPNWITEKIDDERLSEHNPDGDIEAVRIILVEHIDFEKLNSAMPKLYYPDRSNKIWITAAELKQELT